MKKFKKNIVGLRELRENMEQYIKRVQKGNSFVVVRRSKPVFEINPFNEKTQGPTHDSDAIWDLPQKAVKTDHKTLATDIDTLLYAKK